MPRFVWTLIAVCLVVPVLHAGSIEGQVIVKRKLSRRTVTAPASAYQRGSAVELARDYSEDPLAFERTRVVIYLDGDLGSHPLAERIEQKNRRFTQDLTVVQKGSTISFPNEDSIFHNVFSLSKPKIFDLGTYPKGQSRSVTLTKPGIVYVNCHLHPNMGAAIVVTPNRWNTRPDAGGSFSLADVPPGLHSIVAWHKAVGFFRQQIEVKTDSKTRVVFLIPFEGEEPATALSQR